MLRSSYFYQMTVTISAVST